MKRIIGHRIWVGIARKTKSLMSIKVSKDDLSFFSATVLFFAVIVMGALYFPNADMLTRLSLGVLAVSGFAIHFLNMIGKSIVG